MQGTTGTKGVTATQYAVSAVEIANHSSDALASSAHIHKPPSEEFGSQEIYDPESDLVGRERGENSSTRTITKTMLRNRAVFDPKRYDELSPLERKLAEEAARKAAQIDDQPDK